MPSTQRRRTCCTQTAMPLILSRRCAAEHDRRSVIASCIRNADIYLCLDPTYPAIRLASAPGRITDAYSISRKVRRSLLRPRSTAIGHTEYR